jgi:L-threonylcarbamoyladenylate synthase
MMPKFEEDIKESLSILKAGGTILYPTDTLWGLGCDATNGEAVERIFKIKQRKESKSLIVLVNGESMLERYVKYIPEIVFDIIGIADKPLTIIYPEGKNLDTGIYSEDGSVGIRICKDDFCNQLITRFMKPIVSTSANISGSPPPANFPEIDKSILASVGYIVKHRQKDLSKYPPSQIIKVETNGVIKIIRE